MPQVGRLRRGPRMPGGRGASACAGRRVRAQSLHASRPPPPWPEDAGRAGRLRVRRPTGADTKPPREQATAAVARGCRAGGAPPRAQAAGRGRDFSARAGELRLSQTSAGMGSPLRARPCAGSAVGTAGRRARGELRLRPRALACVAICGRGRVLTPQGAPLAAGHGASSASLHEHWCAWPSADVCAWVCHVRGEGRGERFVGPMRC